MGGTYNYRTKGCIGGTYSYRTYSYVPAVTVPTVTLSTVTVSGSRGQWRYVALGGSLLLGVRASLCDRFHSRC